jgi:ABC-type lipoprotein release transport system permease subunit
MAASTYARLAGIIFGLVALAHLARLVFAVPVTIGATTIPMPVSWAGLVVAGALCVLGLRARG